MDKKELGESNGTMQIFKLNKDMIFKMGLLQRNHCSASIEPARRQTWLVLRMHIMLVQRMYMVYSATSRKKKWWASKN